jgi:hypothetical protein
MSEEATEFSPWLAYDAVVRAIQASTELRAMDELLGDRTTPSPLLHRRFRLNPDRLDFDPVSKARPGDVVLVTERVTILLAHDLNHNARAASYELACSDWVELLRAVLTRTEISGLAQPLSGALVRRQVGHTIEQSFVLSLQYHITLPEAA